MPHPHTSLPSPALLTPLIAVLADLPTQARADTINPPVTAP
jgi:hypothetical protein